MIEEFIQSFDLFGSTYATGMGAAAVLSLVGIFMYARNQLFSGMASAQMAMFGFAVSLLSGEINPYVIILLMAFLSSFMMNFSDHQNPENGERVAAWIFLAATSFTVLLLVHSPHGLEEINHLMASRLMGAASQEAASLWICFLLIGLWVASLRKKLTLFLIDSEGAMAFGLKALRWILLISLTSGVGIGLALKSTGMLFTFAYLVLPPMFAASICRSTRQTFFIAPLTGLLTSCLAFMLANHWDLPLAQMAVAVMCTIVFFVKSLKKIGLVQNGKK